MKTDYSREELLKICKKAVVPNHKWRDRDSSESQLGVGQCWVLLKAGCEFEIKPDTDDRTIWIQFYVRDFMWFECSDSDNRGNPHECQFYLPTKKRLKKMKGRDWY